MLGADGIQTFPQQQSLGAGQSRENLVGPVRSSWVRLGNTTSPLRNRVSLIVSLLRKSAFARADAGLSLD
jgi:hypothetical protein